MIGLSDIFSSKARVEVLRVLFVSSQSLRLRQIEKLSGLQVRSVQVALSSLMKEKLITRKQNQYFLNSNHHLFKLLNSVFDQESDYRIKSLSARLQKRGPQVLEFADSVVEFLTGTGKK